HAESRCSGPEPLNRFSGVRNAGVGDGVDGTLGDDYEHLGVSMQPDFPDRCVESRSKLVEPTQPRCPRFPSDDPGGSEPPHGLVRSVVTDSDNDVDPPTQPWPGQA